MAFPAHGLRWQKTKQAHRYRMQAAVLVCQHAPDHRLTRHEGPPRLARKAAKPIKIGRHDGKLRLCQRLTQERQALAEFVVAERGRVIAKLVHRRDHRMGVCPTLPPLVRPVRDVIGQRAASEKIAIVQEQAARNLGAGGGDQAGDLGQTPVGGGLVAQVVPRQDMAMQVGGGQNAQGDARAVLCLGRGALGVRTVSHVGIRDGAAP